MAVISQLFRLQQLDAELECQTTALADLRRRERSDPEAEGLAASLQKARTRLTERSAQLRRLEADLGDLEAKIKRDNTRMYAGQIVDPRELGSLERELDHYRVQRDALEENVLATMEGVERGDAEVARLSRESNEQRERRETDQPALAIEAEEMADGLAGIHSERDSLVALLDARSLALYDRLRKARGHAVSRVSGEVCGSCRVSLPPKDVQHAHAGDLVQCTNCERVLYAV